MSCYNSLFLVFFPRTVDQETILKLETVSKTMERLERDLETIQQEVFCSEIENVRQIILSFRK